MKTNRLLAVVLILVSLPVMYTAIMKIADSTKTINVLGLKIEASDESGQTEGYVYLAMALALFIGGIYVLGKSSKS